MRTDLALRTGLLALVALLALAGCASSRSLPGRIPPTPVATSSAPGHPGRFTLARRIAGGRLLLTRLRGTESKMVGKVWVWLPPQYDQRRYSRTAFPVVILYPGGSGANYNYWTDPRVLPAQADDVRLVKEGRAHPFIMVMPVMQPSAREDTECSDIPGHPRIGTWESVDVPALVRASFRTQPGPDGWGTAGASSGAFCAVKIAVERPDVFGAAVSWGGYFEPETNLRWSAAGMRANSPDLILPRTRPGLRLLLMASTRRDAARVTALVKLIRPPTVATTYVRPDGTHTTGDLRTLVPTILRFLTQNTRGLLTEHANAHTNGSFARLTARVGDRVRLLAPPADGPSAPLARRLTAR